MDEQLIQSVNREVFRRFPELRGYKPKVQPYRGAKSQSFSGYVLLYSTQAVVPSGKHLGFRVRVLTDQQGRIVRITTSH